MAETRRAEFFDRKNESMLDRLLTADFQRRIGGELNEKQTVRLQKTVRHYMTEIYQENTGKSVQFLNKEVLTSVVPDYLSYLRRSSGPSLEENVPVAIRSDVSTRFGQLQNERQEAQQAQPVAPDFRISLEMEGATPLSRFEEVKRIREAEAAREAETAAAMTAARTAGPSQELVIVQRDSSMGRFIDSGDDFRSAAVASNERDQLSLIMREAELAVSGRSVTEIVDLPDPRRILLGDNKTLPENARNRGIASANPTTAIAERVRERPLLQQDVLRPQDDIVSYKEIENNLFIYSADRDWVNNTTETRYNFSVTFDPANNSQSFGYNTATNIKFKNIVRIEFVKAIMPTEGIDILQSYNGTAINTDLNVNILSLPYLQVRIPELNVNGYGTNDGINNAFAAISYDAYWTGDSSAKNRGFARMIPKFLKCQKVYYPTPLATLQKLSFQIQKPDGTLVSTTQDTLDISEIYMPSNTAATTVYRSLSAGTWDFIWLQTSTYFSKFSVTQGDRIIIKNITLNATLAANTNAQNLINFLRRAEGHLVCDVGKVTGGTPTYSDTLNGSGYTNGIIIRNNFNDPTTGSVTVQPWVTSIAAAVNSNPSVTKGRLINMNHQIQLIMRVITREMDSAAKLRPDNLQA
jgi:hypothetical protein